MQSQQWLLNFVYSFIQKPKHIFLVHGEPNAQLVLKDKIISKCKYSCNNSRFWRKYTLDDNFAMEKPYNDPSR